jgi:hypothetical protein
VWDSGVRMTCFDPQYEQNRSLSPIALLQEAQRRILSTIGTSSVSDGKGVCPSVIDPLPVGVVFDLPICTLVSCAPQLWQKLDHVRFTAPQLPQEISS